MTKRILFLNFLFLLCTIYSMAQVSAQSDYLHRENLDGKEQTIFYTLYQPENQKVVGTLVILHGMQEHSGRYEKIAHYFSNRGYAVLAYDHLGHGKTAKTPDEHGYFLKKKGTEQLVADAALVSNHLHNLYPEKPHFILGHSMGSFITRVFLQHSSGDFNGAIIVGTGGKIFGISLAKAYMRIKNSLAPTKRPAGISRTFAKMNHKRFKKTEGENYSSWLSLSRENQEAFKADSLNGIPFTNNGYYTLVTVNKRATKKRWAKNIDPRFPMLFVSGANDPIGNFGKGVKQTTADLHKQGFENITTRLYPEMRHEILNEAIQEEVFEEILKWTKDWK